MKKLFITVFAFISTHAYACSVDIEVVNHSSHRIDKLIVKGPYLRQSKTKTLEPNESFTYHAKGSMFSCHGLYLLENESYNPKYNVISNPDAVPSPTATKDSSIVFEILDECQARGVNPDAVECLSRFDITPS